VTALPARPPRAILEVLWGQLGGSRALVEPGAEIQVGRAHPSHVQVPHDRQMSGVHFALRWDGAEGRVRDLGSAGGTWVDGLPAADAPVKQGSWIRAGDTVFFLHVEATPALSDLDVSRSAGVLAALRASGQPLYALLDAARSPAVSDLLRGAVQAQASLYEGVQGQLLASVAPRLVALPPSDSAPSLLDALVARGWGRSWGVYLACGRPFAEVRRHFRRLLMVDVETGGPRPERGYFRFYDPRVLRAFLPICNARQREEMFGDVETFWAEGEEGEVLRFDKAGSPLGDAVEQAPGARLP
jgi:hypothetical protein